MQYAGAECWKVWLMSSPDILSLGMQLTMVTVLKYWCFTNGDALTDNQLGQNHVSMLQSHRCDTWQIILEMCRAKI